MRAAVVLVVLVALPAAAQEAPRAPLQRPPVTWGPAPSRTSVEAKARRLTVAAGYLCGLDRPGDDASHGPFSSYGAPGTFVGARLGLAFP